MRVLITGGAGFIGSNLVRAVLAQGHQVVVLDDLSTGSMVNLAGSDIDWFEGSVTSPVQVDAAMSDVEAVVHLAALGSVPRSILRPMATHDANATGTLVVLEAARRSGVRHLLYSSSSSVYGSNPALPKCERDWVRPLSPYAVSKLAAEQYVLAYQESFGLSTMAFRFFNVYGPHQRAGHPYAAVIPVFVDALLRGEPLTINGEGLHSRDFTFVGTVCRVLVEALARGLSHPEPVNLAFGGNTTLLDLIGIIEAVSGIKPAVTHRDERPGDVRHSQADNAVLRRLFPDLRPTLLVDGIRQTIDWFRAEIKNQ